MLQTYLFQKLSFSFQAVILPCLTIVSCLVHSYYFKKSVNIRFLPTGLITSITLPCYHQGKFIGVVGTDISMADLLSEITYFQKGQSSHAFMADSSGRTMMHPLLPAPSNAFGDPIFMDITSLEPEPEFYSVFESIKR